MMASKKSERSYGLSAQEIKELAEEFKASKKFPNPHRTGSYKFTLDALRVLGVNKAHPIAKVHAAFKKAAGDDWYEAWASKKSRNKETGKDADERFLQNLQVLQRTKDYGRRLLEVGRRVLKSKGAVIDLSRDDKGKLLVTLNTNSATPQKAGRALEAKANPKRQKAAAKRKANGKSRRPKAESEQPQ
jgi:hypothetical protein